MTTDLSAPKLDDKKMMVKYQEAAQIPSTPSV